MSQVYTQVSIDTRGVATLMLNRPEVHDAFDDAHDCRVISRA